VAVLLAMIIIAMAFAQTYLIRKIRRLYLAVSLPKEGSPVSKALDIDVR